MTKQSLIILPGWEGSHETWQDFVNFVKKDFDNVNVIDLPCFGRQPCPKEIWDIDNYTKFVKDEIERLNLKETILLGHSFGGQVAVNLITKYPNTADKLILSGAAIFRPKNLSKRLFLGVLAKAGKIAFKLPIIKKFDVLAKKVLYCLAGSRNYTESSGIKQDIFKKIIRQDIRHLLPKINIPTLILWGKKDKMTPFKYGEKISKLIPNATMYVVKRGRHGLHRHNKKEISSVIKEFLEHDK